jgi:hypothetical protein
MADSSLHFSRALPSAPSHMYLAYGCVQNGPPARRSEPDGWLFFRVARSLRINLDMLVAPALKNSQLTGGHMPATYETAH